VTGPQIMPPVGGMTVEGGQLFLSHGGFVPGFTKYGSVLKRPATGKSPSDIVLPEISELE
jgi:hypothetical protein